MSLTQYKSKRDFKQTPEPDDNGNAKDNKKLVFVIQRHQASRLHYDFRLEMKGVLKSWAVPKGPSLYPPDKRLAMMVEDHPYDYRNFEGVIPEGNYGAGVVEVWDEGTYEHIEIKDTKKGEKQLLEDLQNGSIKIVLHGKRLKGEFALVKIKGDKENNAWLLIKHNDKYAVDKPYSSEEHTDADSEVTKEVKRRAAEKGKKKVFEVAAESKSIKTADVTISKEKKYSDFISPMLAKIGEEPFSDPDWVFEVKWDGYRAVAEVDKGKVKLYSRNGLTFEKKYPEIAAALTEWNDTAIIDGEIVALDEEANPNFQLLQHYSEAPENTSLVYYVFDLLEYKGKEMYDKPLLERKELLKKILPQNSAIRYCEHVEKEGLKFFDWAKSKNIEGVVAKKADSHYYPDKRSNEWKKIRNHNIQEVVIAGFTEPQGSRKHFGSLVLGMYDGKQLHYVGHVGTGFDDQSLKELYARMIKLKQKETPFKKMPKQVKRVTWLKPELVCNIKYTEWTRDKQLRHPVFMGLRIDKEAPEVQKNEETMAVVKEKKTKNETTTSSLKKKKGEHLELVEGHEVKLTHLEKMYFPEDKVTKGDVINYYQSVAEHLLPYLKDRPESLKRNPNGISNPGFYHKDVGDEAPEWVPSIPIHSESNDKDVDYILCNEKATLMYMNNLGCIEINPWNSRTSALDNPDYMVIDLDPSDKNTFDQVVETALVVKEILDKAGAESYCKTSGATGLHVYVPMGAQYTYDHVKEFAHLVATIVEERLDFTTLERQLNKRKNRIYIDYLQNRTGQTLSSVYSLRPKKGATVSTPLEWKEVKKGLTPSQFTIHNIKKRIEEKGDLFKGVLGKGIDMRECLKNLGEE